MSEMRALLARKRAADLGLGTKIAAGRLLAGLVDQPWIDAASRYYSPQETLQWPARDGWFSRGYGSGENGYHRAFDIMGPMGLDVLAAAPGIVGYVGNSLSGYGNLIIIVHPRGWVTAYGHNQHMHVIPGEYVNRGQVIASMGSTGRSTGPHLHFEFIVRGKNCDPAALFRPAVMHPNGKHSSIKQARWPLNSESRPKDIRCGVRMRHPITNEKVTVPTELAPSAEIEADTVTDPNADPSLTETVLEPASASEIGTDAVAPSTEISAPEAVLEATTP